MGKIWSLLITTIVIVFGVFLYNIVVYFITVSYYKNLPNTIVNCQISLRDKLLFGHTKFDETYECKQVYGQYNVKFDKLNLLRSQLQSNTLSIENLSLLKEAYPEISEKDFKFIYERIKSGETINVDSSDGVLSTMRIELSSEVVKKYYQLSKESIIKQSIYVLSFVLLLKFILLLFSYRTLYEDYQKKKSENLRNRERQKLDSLYK